MEALIQLWFTKGKQNKYGKQTSLCIEKHNLY